MEIDLSIRDHSCSVQSRKRTVEPVATSPQEKINCDNLQTPEHVKRLRFEIENAFESNGFSGRENVTFESEPTEKETFSKSEQFNQTFRHAGLFYEYGGLKAHKQLLESEKTARIANR